ncbi:MAG TPA: acyl-CoA dehydrogenase family protein [Aggregatilineales bacterium]|nr:acyl-CoA/acyl-ACP dehydrogenase [Anaerolineales bacterium]HRE48274.1 acyl-CoA dehydrogenase family protein [Aggregatilineales bacterium]
MTRPDMLALAEGLATKFAITAAKHDAEGTFPHANFAAIREAGLPRLPVPLALGGWGGGLGDAVRVLERLAMGDGSTALAFAMHLQTIGMAVDKGEWSAGMLARISAEINERGVLLNSCATEPELGSPSRGGRPQTTAHRQEGGYRISGRKTFASMSPVLDYFIVPAALQDEPTIGRFLIPPGEGVRLDETWDALGMRGTGSHDLILEDVFVPETNLLALSSDAPADPNKAQFNAWFTLCVCAVYLGVAAAAQRVALDYAQTRVPTALGRPIATLESIQRRLGEGEFDLNVARALLHHTAALWDSAEGREEIGAALITAKGFITNAAIRVVDGAMRVAGGVSMTHTLPLERYYRDVRAGLFHPPADDAALPLLGRLALRGR